MSVATFPRTRQLFILFLLLLFGQVIAAVLMMVSGALLGDSEGPAQWLYPLIGLISMAPAIRYTWRRSGRPVFRYDWSILRSRRMVAGLLFAFALIGFGSGLLIGYLPTADAIPEVGDDLTPGIGMALTIIVIAPVLEEWLFRGLLLEQLLATRSERKAIVIASLIFGISHLIPAHAVGAAIVGLGLGYLYVRTRSLLLVTLMHLFLNGIAYIGDVVGPEGVEFNDPFTEIPLALLNLAVGFYLLLFFTAKLAKRNSPMPSETPIEDYVPQLQQVD
jgi:membrane protease YdiL (CAAX protease family)